MTTFTFPDIVPTNVAWELQSNIVQYPSPISGTIQTQDRGGEYWRVRMQFNNLRGDEKAELKAFLVKLNGQQHRFTLHDYSQIQRGAFGGTPLVFGAGQTGTLLQIDGCTPSITGWIKAGDYFSVDGRLKMAVADKASSVGGFLTIDFVPRIVTAPANNEPIITTAPTGTFMLANTVNGWLNDPGDFGQFTIEAFEDILA